MKVTSLVGFAFRLNVCVLFFFSFQFHFSFSIFFKISQCAAACVSFAFLNKFGFLRVSLYIVLIVAYFFCIIAAFGVTDFQFPFHFFLL